MSHRRRMRQSTTFVANTRLALRLTPIVHPGNTVIPTTSASRRASLTMTVLWGIIVIIMPVRLVLHADRMKGVRVGNTVMHRISAFTTITPVREFGLCIWLKQVSSPLPSLHSPYRTHIRVDIIHNLDTVGNSITLQTRILNPHKRPQY